jgi:hypothetical protein
MFIMLSHKIVHEDYGQKQMPILQFCPIHLDQQTITAITHHVYKGLLVSNLMR